MISHLNDATLFRVVAGPVPLVSEHRVTSASGSKFAEGLPFLSKRLLATDGCVLVHIPIEQVGWER